MKYVILGASAAGINGAKELRKIDRHAEIILVSKDKKIYSRCMLHHFLSGERNLKEISFVEPDLMENYNIKWIKGTSAINMDTNNKKIGLDNGQILEYDKVLIATGSRSTFLNIPNLDKCNNVHGFRNIEDAIILKERVKVSKNIVVLGGGLVGLDAVCGTLSLGINNISIVEMADRLLCRQLDKRAASSYENALEERGVKLIFNTSVTSVECDKDNNISTLNLSNGDRIACDLLIITVGVKSNTDFLDGSDVIVDQYGIVVDSFGSTNVANVFAAGDVTGRGPIWSVAAKEGIVAANTMCYKMADIADYFYYKSTMNFLGINSMSIGINEIPDDSYNVETYDDGKVYKRVIYKDGYITGAILQNDIAYGGVITKLVASKININEVKKPLFKIDFSDFFNIDNRNSKFYYLDDKK